MVASALLLAGVQKKQDFGWLVLGLFFCSGATALVYEVVWSKYLSQMFGSTIQAQTVVLAVFMGGLALGNRIFGGKADQLRGPIRVYGMIELAIGLYAFFFSSLFRIADGVFVHLGAQVLNRSGLLLALKGGLSVALLLIPTVLMGGTLPLLAAWLQKRSSDAGRQSARFYSVNSLGAVFGAGLAGFYLVENWGMVAALQLTALANLVIGGLAIGLNRSREQAVSPQKAAPAPGIGEICPASVRWAGALVALTGGVSMGLEVIASRSLVLLFGSSLQSFALVLMAFILGIGLGSAAIASRRLQQWQRQKLVIALLLAVALWIGLLVFRIEGWVEFYRMARTGLARSTVGYFYHQVVATLLSMLVLGVPAALLGSVLPLMIRSIASAGSSLGEQVGRLLTWNTVGAVGGVLLTGFLLMPRVGLRGSFGVLAAGLCVVALFTARRERLGAWSLLSSVVLGAVLMLWSAGGEGWRHVMSSGVFRSRETEFDASVFDLRKKHIQILFYEDAADATVSVEKGDGIGAVAETGLRINGKAEASTHGDLCTQLLLGHLPMLARPQSKDVFVLGLGSGITAGALLGHPIEHLTVAENCRPVIRAARFFESDNRGVLTNRLTKIWQEDARTILKLSPQKYDIIITQPSNPWMAGVGSVFSREYYELAASRLKEGGIMAQWFHLYEMHDGIVNLVLRTFGTVFPHLEVWDTGSGDVVLLGAKEPWPCTLETLQTVFDRAEPRRDLQALGILSPAALLARQLASQQTAFAIADDGPIQSDLFPILEYEAPRAFYIGKNSTMLFRFDERTWQHQLAPKEKSFALAGLSDELLKRLFSSYTTANTDLLSHLTWRIRNAEMGNPGGARDPLSSPCVFAPVNLPVAAPKVPANISDQIKQLLLAENWIVSRSDKRKEGVEVIASLLRAPEPGSDWSRAHYGAVAIKASIAEGDMQEAKQVLALAIESEPQDVQLRYLSRLISRVGSGQLAAAKTFKLPAQE